MNSSMLLIILLLLPLSGAIINGIFGKRLPKIMVGGLATGVMLAAFAVVCTLFRRQLPHKRLTFSTSFAWMTLASMQVFSSILFPFGCRLLSRASVP